MSDVIDYAEGGYRFLEGVSQYSSGVAALPGYRLERIRFAEPPPLEEGFARAAKLIEAAGRPATALAACELRSPAPFSEEGFIAFNRSYERILEGWGLLARGQNPVARSNVCPEAMAPAVPSLYAFTFTRSEERARPSCVVSGSAEVPEGHALYRDHIVGRGDVSETGLRAKAEFVLQEMERRFSRLGFGWREMTGVQAYTVHNLYPFFADDIVRRGAAGGGLTWHFNRPPVVDLEFEMDCRCVTVERTI